MVIKALCNENRPQRVLAIAIAFSIFFTSILSAVALKASGISSADKPFDTQSALPQVKMIYENKAYDMSTFVTANNGEMKKIVFPEGDPPDDGSNPPIPLQIGSTVHFQFDKQPIKVSAYIIDMEALPVELYAQRQVGPNDFQIVGPTGVLNFEVHALFPDGQYISEYKLAEIGSGSNPTIKNLIDNRAGFTDNNRYSGYIGFNGYQGFYGKQQCTRPERLHILQITSNSHDNNKASSIGTVLNDSNLQTAWSFKGTDVKTLVKSSLESSAARASQSSDTNNHWLQLDLGTDKTVCYIGVAFPNGDKSINFFEVQTSTDGQHFVDVGTAESYPLVAGGQVFAFPDMPFNARYVRISDIGDIISGDTEISELMAAGK